MTATAQDARIAAICAALAQGVSRRGACALAGISADTLYRWMHEDRTCSDAVARAEAAFEQTCISALKRPFEDAASPGEAARAAQWALSHHPQLRADWGERLDVRLLDDEQLMRLLSAAEGRGVQRGTAAEPAIDADFTPAGELPPGTDADSQG